MKDYPRVTLPDELEGHEVIVSASGGKDSTALMLALKEAEIPFRAVLADTGWEYKELKAYVAMLRRRVAPVEVVRAEFDEEALATLLRDLDVPERFIPELSQSAMVARAMLRRTGFPARRQRWCTRELKIEPLQDFAQQVAKATGNRIASAVGVRADESSKRQALLGNAWDGELEREAETPLWWVWRPLLRWTVDEVLRIHLYHDVPVNPLYHQGHNRVGCAPCIHSQKEEVRLMAKSHPERVEIIRVLEAAMTKLRKRRNAEALKAGKDKRYNWENATFFQGREGSPAGVEPSIDTVVEWSRTSHGGRQLVLLEEPAIGGCMRWGLCDVPERDTDDADADGEAA